MGEGWPFDWPGDRRGVLCLHGFTGTPFEVRPLGERLAARGLTVVGPLLAGHGTSPAALAASTWRDWEASARAALEELLARCDRVAIAGLSMGGLLALRLALALPERVSALALLAVPIWLPRLQTGILRLLGRLGHPRALPKLSGSDVRDAEARRANPAYREMPVAGILELLDLQATVRAELGRVATPTIILHGRHDHTAPPGCASALAARLGAREVRLEWLERSYHLLPLDVERERVAALCGDFLVDHLHLPKESA